MASLLCQANWLPAQKSPHAPSPPCKLPSVLSSVSAFRLSKQQPCSRAPASPAHALAERQESLGFGSFQPSAPPSVAQQSQRELEAELQEICGEYFAALRAYREMQRKLGPRAAQAARQLSSASSKPALPVSNTGIFSSSPVSLGAAARAAMYDQAVATLQGEGVTKEQLAELVSLRRRLLHELPRVRTQVDEVVEEHALGSARGTGATHFRKQGDGSNCNSQFSELQVVPSSVKQWMRSKAYKASTRQRRHSSSNPTSSSSSSTPTPTSPLPYVQQMHQQQQDFVQGAAPVPPSVAAASRAQGGPTINMARSNALAAALQQQQQQQQQQGGSESAASHAALNTGAPFPPQFVEPQAAPQPAPSQGETQPHTWPQLPEGPAAHGPRGGTPNSAQGPHVLGGWHGGGGRGSSTPSPTPVGSVDWSAQAQPQFDIDWGRVQGGAGASTDGQNVGAPQAGAEGGTGGLQGGTQGGGAHTSSSSSSSVGRSSFGMSSGGDGVGDSGSALDPATMSMPNNRLRNAALAAARYKMEKASKGSSSSGGGSGGAPSSAAGATQQQQHAPAPGAVELGNKQAVYSAPRRSRANPEEVSFLVPP